MHARSPPLNTQKFASKSFAKRQSQAKTDDGILVIEPRYFQLIDIME